MTLVFPYNIVVLLLTDSVLSLELGEEVAYAQLGYSNAFHMEEDLRAPGSLIISTYGSLRTVRKGEDMVLLVGDEKKGHKEGIHALFDLVSGFRQVNTTHIIVVDQRNHCLRYVNRLEKRTWSFAGRCTESGFVDGEADKARFNRPYDLIDGFYKHEYYVTDKINNAVRLIKSSKDTLQITVLTVVQNSAWLERPVSVVLDSVNEALFVIGQSGLVKIGIHDKQLEQLTISVNPASEGQISSSMFRESRAIILMNLATFLIADWRNRRLSLLDNNFTLSAVTCGDQAPCSAITPYCISLSAHGDKLYLAQSNRIKVFNLPESVIQQKVTQPDRPTTTSTTFVTTDKGTNEPPSTVPGFTANWMTYTVIAAAIAGVVLINVILLIMLKCRRTRRRRRKRSRISVPVGLAPQHPSLMVEEYQDPITTSIEAYSATASYSGYEPVDDVYEPVDSGYEPVNSGYEPVDSGYEPVGNPIQVPCMEQAKLIPSNPDAETGSTTSSGSSASILHQGT